MSAKGGKMVSICTSMIFFLFVKLCYSKTICNFQYMYINLYIKTDIKIENRKTEIKISLWPILQLSCGCLDSILLNLHWNKQRQTNSNSMFVRAFFYVFFKLKQILKNIC